MDETRTAATERINQILREEHTGYDFEGLRDRFRSAYYEGADVDPDYPEHSTFTIKPPSGYELAFPEADILLALFGEDSTIWAMFTRKRARREAQS